MNTGTAERLGVLRELVDTTEELRDIHRHVTLILADGDRTDRQDWLRCAGLLTDAIALLDKIHSR